VIGSKQPCQLRKCMGVGGQEYDARFRLAVQALDRPDAPSPGPRVFAGLVYDDEPLHTNNAGHHLVMITRLLLQQWMFFSNLCIWFAMMFPTGSEHSHACGGYSWCHDSPCIRESFHARSNAILTKGRQLHRLGVASRTRFLSQMTCFRPR